MSTADYPFEETVRELESVAGEIARLRDSVKEHRQAATGLESVATALGELTSLLPSLPSEIQAQFSGVPALVSSLEAALRPAGVLEHSLKALSDSNEKLLEKLRLEREETHAMMAVLRDDAAALRDLLHQLDQEAKSRFAGLELRVLERASSVEIAELSAAIGGLAESMQMVQVDIRQLSKVHGEYSATHAQESEVIKARLAKLTGLARRGFFAILRGKDAAPDPS